MYARSWSSTSSLIALVPPTTTMSFGRSRSSSVLVAAGISKRRTSSTGAWRAFAAGAAARASGNDSPVATYTYGTPGVKKWLLIRAAVA